MFIIIVLALVSSIALNGVLLWYMIKLLDKLYYIQDNTDAILSVNDGFKEHLQGLNEMEMYYGDETLTGLLEHSKHVVEQMEIFGEVLVDLEQVEDDEETEEG